MQEALDLPPGCQDWRQTWPWPHALPHVVWRGVTFTADAMCEAAFAEHGIALPTGLGSAVAKRRAEFLAGRLCARDALRAVTGRAEVPGVAETRAPCWPAGTVGSITHSAGFAAALAAPARHWQGLGLDAETPMPAARATRLAPQILTPRERDWRDRLPAEAQALFTTLAFSCKESLFKALFPLVQRRFYFQDAELADWQPDEGRVTLRLLTTLAPDWPADTPCHGQYVADPRRLLSVIALPQAHEHPAHS
ncbi:4'-phosphopantetheinyl transferase family protein [Chromohalobacter israelensis]|uniref:4'-phosphopantetheinyl transferase family protein n=1 Tax=Chromohalobacter israelensis TaxID=141390 RepID=UPI001CC76DBA|nr:4'-phosphopantetheinyl transferase superfamily protein [Chromohalobacter salexigens]MBZ5875534.1 4'-phosphopantetheinyl transferase superfamily protein [Chromohalobacter salexigens]